MSRKHLTRFLYLERKQAYLLDCMSGDEHDMITSPCSQKYG